MEEVSAFAIYKKGIGKASAKKITPKGNKKAKGKKSPQKTPVKSAQVDDNVNKEVAKVNGSVKQVKKSRKRKQKDVTNGTLNNSNSVVETAPAVPITSAETTPNVETPKKSVKNARKRKQSEPPQPIAEAQKPAKKKAKKAKQPPVDSAKSPGPGKDSAQVGNSPSVVKKEPQSPTVNIPLRNNSTKEGAKLFKWLLAPVGVDQFLENFWEKAPCLVERSDPSYFSKLISFNMIDQMLIDNHLEFTKNIDITSYKNGKRETLNPEGRATPPVVWDHYSNGCSVRLLNPQTYLPAMFTLNTTLQEFFHCMVGSNSYLTPPNSQGFAPHYDDIEAFVLQIEGRKRWKLYNPRSKKEELPRFSSENFSQDEIGEPILEKVLKPGDILYFPRGTIHQAFTEPGFHSLHITLSVYQKQSYADLMEKMFPLILQRAIAENVDFRRGLPLNVWHNAGIVFSDVDTPEREAFLRKCRDLIAKSVRELPVDQAVDQLAKKFQHEALPPEITVDEKARTIFGSKNIVSAEGQCIADYEITSMTKVRLLRANILRLVEEEDKIRIYYYLDNSKEYCEYDPNYLEIEPDDASSVEVLIKSYPEYVAVNELPLDDDEDRKISIVQALWERGLLMFDRPFK